MILSGKMVKSLCLPRCIDPVLQLILCLSGRYIRQIDFSSEKPADEPLDDDNSNTDVFKVCDKGTNEGAKFSLVYGVTQNNLDDLC